MAGARKKLKLEGNKSIQNQCDCRNACNRKGSRRGACPCLFNGNFCTDFCTCGLEKIPCTNRPGRPGSILSAELELSLMQCPSSSESEVSNCMI